ncbi:MAG: transposase [Candidatus Dormibacteraceae bacterium]
MHDSKVRSRLKAQLTKFSCELCAGLSKPLGGFVSQMLFGIQSSQDVKLSNIGRCLKEDISLIRTEKRLSRNLKKAELEKELTQQLVRMGSPRIQPHTVLALDLSDIRKEYAQKMEHLAIVRDGSTGELHQGYWLCDVTAAEVNGSEIVPLYQKLFSVEAQEFTSENTEVLAAVDLIRTYSQGRGIWTMDRGGDRKRLLEPLLDRGEHFVIRSTGKRTVIDRRNLQGSVAEVAGRCRLRHQARILKIQDGKEKTYELRYGAEPIHLSGRPEQLWLVVVAGFGEAPLMLLTDLPIAAKDSQSLWWIVQIYLTRWKIEETFRCIKQSYNLEDIRVMKYQRLKNLVILVTAAAYFAATYLGQQMKLRILCEKLLIISQRFFGIPPFRFYALADGIRRILSQATFSSPETPPASLQLELTLGWEG